MSRNPVIAKMSREQLEREVISLRRSVAALKLHADRRKHAETIDGRPLADAMIAARWSAVTVAKSIPIDPATLRKWSTGVVRVPVAKARRVVAVFVEAGAEPPAFVFGET